MPKPSLNDFLSAASFWPVKEISVSAWVEHAPFVFWLMDTMRPASVVELGTHTGYSFFAMCQAAKALGLDTELYAVDTWEGDVHAGAYEDSVYDAVKAVADRDYPEHAHLVRATFDDARTQFPDHSVDLVHVDGRHFYEDARHDVDTYLSALSDKGVMILHDIVVHERDFGVHQVWEELKAQYDTFAFEHCNGLGVVAVGPEAAAKVRALTQLPEGGQVASLVRAAYARLGAAVPTPWLIDDPAVGAALARLPELEQDLDQTRRELATVGGELATTRARLQAAQATMGRFGAMGRLAGAIPARVTTRAAKAAARMLHRVDPSSNPIKEIFDDKWYASTYGIAGDRAALLQDFVQHGAAKGRNPSPLFDAKWYAEQNPDLAELTVLELVEHYVTQGGIEGRSPHPFFDARYYLENNPDIVVAGANPLVHYIHNGDAEGRRPNPYFDPGHYRQVSNVKGFAAGAYLSSPLPRLSPSDEFDPDWYQATYDDAADSDLDPLIFHLTLGEGRPASPDDSTGREVILDTFGALVPYRSVRASRPGNITMVTDSVAPDALFGGVATALILAAQWATSTGRKLRIVTRRGQASSKGCSEVWRLAKVPVPETEFVVYRTSGDNYLDIADDDLWLTTSWWTTAAIRATVDPEKVVYLLQEDERSFYPSGDQALKAWAEMSRPTGLTIVNSRRLYEVLVEDGAANLVDKGTWFEASFASFAKLRTQHPMKPRRSLFFYSRPKNARNLFHLGTEVLTRAFERGVLNPAEWTVYCVGQGTPEHLSLGGAWTVVHESLSWPQYSELVSSIDVGLSLMSTPHTSYPPLDLVAAGCQVVTNSWPGKNGLEQYGPRLIVVEPTVEALVDALALADERSRTGTVDTGSPEILSRTWTQQLADVVSRLASEYAGV